VAASAIPAALRAFLSTCIDALEQVELLVRLQQSAESCNAHTLARELGIADASARHHLETLVARGLLQAAISGEVQYRYAPRSPELQRLSELLLRFWAESRADVIRTVATAANPLNSFSNAFKLRKDD
jgi:predicted DNA-binding transcriptional regulator